MKSETRPWGEFTVLKETDFYKTKEIIVKMGKRLSYQYHNKRSEIWVITKGKALVTLNDKNFNYKEGDVVFIQEGSKHRVENIGSVDLVLIEVQRGSYFGEDDIIRLEDDFNRI